MGTNVLEEPAALILGIYGAAGSPDTLLQGTKLNVRSHLVCALCAPDPDTVLALPVCRVKTERDGTRAETRFGLTAKRTSPFISAGLSVQSSTGFLGVRVGGERL